MPPAAALSGEFASGCTVAAALRRRAIEAPRLDPTERGQAEALLKDIGKRTQVSRLDGQVVLGLRAQTNPTARSDSATVLAGGALVNNPNRPDSDTDVQATLRLDHQYDLGLQNEAAIVSSLSAQVVKFSSSSGSTLQANQTDPYNLALIELSAWLKLLLYMSLIACLFMPWGLASSGAGLAALAIGAGAYVAKLAVSGFLLALFETSIAKMRVFRVPEFLGAALMLGLLATLLLFVSRSL